MGPSKAQAAIWEKARSLGTSEQAVPLTDAMCSYLIGRIASDLGIEEHFPELPRDLLPLFTNKPLSSLVVEGHDSRSLFERLVAVSPDADTYFACWAALHKARLKYDRILRTQPIPTLEQVGPRSLLQYGQLSGEALAALLFWRKWFFDIDNRAGQETGYLFEPIIAYAIGGAPAPARRSPVKRHENPGKGRQVDCILQNRAYEFKIRVTIAASGQGRWQEELSFPLDCRKSGFKPVLVCMDSTPNEKLDALVLAFRSQSGEVYIGESAWRHLEELAGETMSRFLDRYVRTPIQDLLGKARDQLPDLTAKWSERAIDILVGDESLHIEREHVVGQEELEPMPEDADDEIPGS